MNPQTIPVITLWQPWASWIMLGVKTIETRLHPRFASLVGRRIGIHAGLRYDPEALPSAIRYTNDDRLFEVNVYNAPRGVILGTAFVWDFRLCAAVDSAAALVDCDNVYRYGLWLKDVHRFGHPVAMPGARGIAYRELPNLKSS